MLAWPPGTSALPGQSRAGAQEGCGESPWGQAGGGGRGPCGPNASPIQGDRGSSLATERRRPAQGPPLTAPSTVRPHEGLLPQPLQLVAPVPCTAWAGRVTAALSLDESSSGPCPPGLLPGRGRLEPPRWPARLLQDPGAPRAERPGPRGRGHPRGPGAGQVLGGPRPLLAPEREAEWGLQVHQALVPPRAPVASPEKQ